VLAESGEVPLHKYPNVMAWMERVGSRESYKTSSQPDGVKHVWQIDVCVSRVLIVGLGEE
jgi:hypothetical protein